MDPERRRQVRNARTRRRANRHDEDGASNGPSAPVTRRPADGDRAAPPPLPSNRRRASTTRDEAQRLSQRMQQQRQDKTIADRLRSQREAMIQERYAPGTAALSLPREATTQQQQQHNADAAAAAVAFDKDELLGYLIGESKANFLKLDHDLTEDHTIATQRLHNSVFAHANSFLLLFRDVDRASDLVEALKANVQGTKAAISNISKYSSANIVANSASSGGVGSAKAPGSAGMSDARANVFSSALSSTLGEGDPRRLARPSLVTRRIAHRYASSSSNGGGNSSELTGEDVWRNNSGNNSSMKASAIGTSSTRATTWASTVQRSGTEDAAGDTASAPAGPTAANSDGGGGDAADDAAMNTGATRPTTRGLNVSSVRQWRYTIGLASASPATTAAAVASASSADRAEARGGDGKSSTNGRRLRAGAAVDKSASAVTTAVAKAEKEATETASFVDIVREEVSQLLTERRHMDAAELLYRLADEATAKGCLPFLLDLEAALVRSVITNVVKIPVTPMFMESLHIPLVQLLLRFGRSRSAAAVYLTMQTPWLHSEVQKLQARVNPQSASLIAVDYLVRVTRATVRRQHTLGLGLDAAQPFMKDAAAVSAPATKDDPKRKAGGAAAAAAAGASSSAGKLIAPNSAALLWVRHNVERFACDVLSTHLLSFGTGTDGGDPTRIRQAAQMISQTSRVMQALSADGFAGCDTLILRQLTPSLVILEDDFTRLTGEKIEHAGRAMMEQLIMGSLIFYEVNEANTAAIAATAEATAAYAAAVAKLSTSLSASAAATGEDTRKAVRGPAVADTAGPRMPPRPPPLRLTPPYTPSKGDDVARKVRARCQEMVQVVRTLPLSGHSLLIQLLLAPASSSLFSAAGAHMTGGSSSSPPPSATLRRVTPSTMTGTHATATAGAGRAGAGRGGGASPPAKAAAVSSPLTALLFHSHPPPPPLSAELFRFLRYANGCSSTQVRLLQSLSGYMAALTGTAHLPAEVMASAAAQEHEGANAAAAAAMRAEQMECVAYLLTSAMVTESIDVVLSNMFTTMLLDLLRQRRALVRFLSSEAFLTHHRRVFPPPTADKAVTASDKPLFADPVNAPGWVLDGTLSLLSDVLGMGVWISYFTRGGAMTHMLADAQLGFRTQHLERVQREVPRLVQGWMCAALLLSSDVTHANTVLAPVRKSATASNTLRAVPAASPLLAPQQSVFFGARAPAREGTGGVGGSAFSPTASMSNRMISNMSFTAVAAAATAAAAQTTMGAVRRDAKDGVDVASVLLSIPVVNGTGAAAGTPMTTTTAAAAGASNGATDAAAATAAFFADAGVREERLLRFLLTLLDRRYCTPAGFTAHYYVVDSATTVDGATGAPCGVWAVRRRLRSYPEFPTGDMWAHRSDEVFLFHWCAQVSLHLLTFFQERLVTPSATLNQRAAEAQGSAAAFLAGGSPFPIEGCITPPEDTVLAGWCAGGGNYITAVALLQFLVMRLLRDGLCRVETWSAVYDSPVAQWRAEESVLRQQLFFFALFLYLWAPLFTGGRAPRPRAGGAPRTAAATAAAAGSPTDDTAVSSYLVDGLPSIAIVEWMTCGGVLSSAAAAANFVDTALVSAAPGTIPPSLTAIDVLFATEGTIHLATANADKTGGVASAGRGGTGAAGGGAAAWKAKTGGSTAHAPAAAAGAATSFAAAGTSTNTMLARRDLFGPGASFIPDSLLRVVRHFFEEQLGESRAIPAITSDMMRNRVEKAMADINLAEFVGTSFGAEDDSESDGASVASSSSAGSAKSAKPAASQRTTLQNLRDLIATYTQPIS
ncbi:hypothetical protein ABB37_01916 [Leptomonas pyrrhocoris]|uniref:Uncharacterized protein n=1 Tax=Leptomonas pyrrhocoris TaxID=157538 RepID=A0A0N0DY36_LEPPY|nr:hypothetical protein ABB37_01916 [Leptomonas pyrrhocoris]KPA83651.1 hypothetical protein ABB37_01916 [Leptomonas pyrrhocoris]|eukprot:XP_015662090.1 hypothetical protein ABB37_01916 [Leptomonas pyrrhocoris]